MRRLVGVVIVLVWVAACGGGGGGDDVIDATVDAADVDGAASNTVWCGLTQRACNTADHRCCGTGVAPDAGDVFTCTDPATTCEEQYDLFCDGPEDCPGQACCGTANPEGGFVTRCQASCGEMYTVCHDAGVCGGAAPTCCNLFHKATALDYGVCVSDPGAPICQP